MKILAGFEIFSVRGTRVLVSYPSGGGPETLHHTSDKNYYSAIFIQMFTAWEYI